jgi:hypothetical protein
MRSGLVAVAVAVALAAVPAVASAAPVAGVYHGVVNGTIKNPCGGNEGEGFFKLRTNNRIAAPGTFRYCGGRATLSTIIAPSNFVCNQFNANLPVDTIPVDTSNKFSRTVDAPIGPGGAIRTVTFRGTWVSDTQVNGVTRVRGDACDSTAHWRMKTPPHA